ncbi:FecR family protein [Formosa sediminum]|uniref:FecR family protein n=1 Tax=Formosa sediminum TaxID=2594004 RepID=UPI00163D5082|nr:FecR domain-containing protein [Formosa sediminum]
MEKTASPEEIQVLSAWIKENPSAYKDYVELHYLITRDKNKDEAKLFKTELLSKFDNLFNLKKKNRGWLKYAAIFITVLASSAYFFLKQANSNTKIQEEITITLGNGTQEVLNTNTSSIISSSDTYVAEQDRTKITYKAQNIDRNDKKQSLVYNTVNVPYGKKFEVVLSDGTEVYLNSGSSFTFPTAFYSTGERHVELTGEAYFSVKSDSLRPFMVKSKDIVTQVLGTEFNFSSYPNDDVTHVVLVEGRVEVSQTDNPDVDAIVLKPNQKAFYKASNSEIKIKDVDVSRYISWKDGVLYFKNETFYHIAKKLERHYSVSIEIKDETLKTERFTGRFKTETIEEVLQGFQRLKDFEYDLEHEKIILTQNKK